MTNNIIDAFIKQTYGSLEAAIESDEKADQHNAAIKNLSQLWKEKTIQHQAQSAKPISEHISIPTKIKQGDLDQHTEAHSHFQNYDHSFEKNRLSELREKYNYVAPDSLIKDIGEMNISTESYNNIDLNSVPDLKGIFDNVFGLGDI